MLTKKKSILIISILIILSVVILLTIPQSSDLEDAKNNIETKVNNLLSRMTLEEKISMLGGYDGMNGNSIERFSIPSLRMANGPHGVGGVDATFFSSGISLAATWNQELVEEVGNAIGREANFHKKDIMLGPCVNIQRMPIGGRNFESYSEDPYLASRMGVAWIKGVQNQDVATCVKHYAGNDQEWERNIVSVEIDERTFREIHLPAFKAAIVEAESKTIMSAYNKFRGVYASENRYLLNDVLRDDWGFDGVVISDWDAVHSTVPTAKAGLDLEMPGPPQYFGDSLLIAVKNGLISEKLIDEKVKGILKLTFDLRLMGENIKPETPGFDTLAHRKLAKKVADQSIVLLKNRNSLLPLNKDEIKSIAILGPMAERASLGGGGSSEVMAFNSVSLLDGIKNEVSNDVKISFLNSVKFITNYPTIPSKYLRTKVDGKYVQGLKGEYFNNVHLKGDPVLTRIDKDVNFNWGQGSPDEKIVVDGFSARWSGEFIAPRNGRYKIAINSNDGSKLFFDGKLLVHNWGNHAATMRSGIVHLQKGKAYAVEIEYFETGNTASMSFEWEPVRKAQFDRKALQLAKNADVVIICVGLNKTHECEGFDREGMDLPGAQNDLIKEVSKINNNTIVVYIGGTPITMTDWIDTTPAVIAALYPGQEEGSALSDIIFGNVNPSGKLPVTFPKRYEDNPIYKLYPGQNSVLKYEEGIFVGYRHYDKYKIEPMFPFGFGLSYTAFEYSDITLNKNEISLDEELTISFIIKNIGDIKGDEVAQIYIKDVEASVERENKSLKAFKRISLNPSEEKEITVKIGKDDLAFYDVTNKKWKAEEGEFKILIGSNSQDIKLSKVFSLK